MGLGEVGGARGWQRRGYRVLLGGVGINLEF